MPDAPRSLPPELGELVHELDRAAPSEFLGVCTRWLKHRVDARGCILLLADYSESSLEPVPDTDASRHDVDGSSAGIAYRHQRAVHLDVPAQPGSRDELCLIYVPVSMRSERLGVLGVTLPAGDLAVATVVEDVAQVLAYVLTGARRYTDEFEALRRRRELGLAAEIQWELLPVLAYELPGFSIAGTLEPAYDIGGDTFDYAVSAQRLTTSITDAVGHGLRAAMLSSLTVATMRNVRRSGGSIVEQAIETNRHLAEQFPGASFVTGLLLELEVATGEGIAINAGHPPPLLLRGGIVEPLEMPADMPLGLFADTRFRPHPVSLLPGDRLLLLTDGIEEAHRQGGPEFGLDRIAEMLLAHAGTPPAEFVRLLTRAVSEHRSGELNDDATAVCLDWHPAGA